MSRVSRKVDPIALRKHDTAITSDLCPQKIHL